MLKTFVRNAFMAAGFEIRRHRPAPAADADAERARLRAAAAEQAAKALARGVTRVQYGSSAHLFPEPWVNVDLYLAESHFAEATCVQADLTEPHPFPDDSFEVGYAEDFLEHLEQEQSLRFLFEARRTLRPSGVLRLVFPGLEGVLKKHYSPPTFAAAELARSEAYEMWGHLHFYSREELRTVALHAGFREVRFAGYGVSEHPALAGLDHREGQRDLNTYAELLK